MFEAIERGEIKALWVMAHQPGRQPAARRRRPRSLERLDLFVVSEHVAYTDTRRSGAHVLLPAAAWGEKDGTVTNSERRISRQRPFLPVAGEARPDWWIMRKSPNGSATGQRSTIPARANLPRTRRAVGLRERRQPRLLARRSCRHERVGVRADEAGTMANSPRRGLRSVSLPKGGSSRPMDAPASSPSPRCPQRGRRRGFPFCSIPAASVTSGTP